MLETVGEIGGPDRDRTGDLFIAKGAAVKNINGLRHRNNALNSRKTGGESTNWAQSKIRAKLDALIARFRAWWQTDDSEERYCWTCRKRTRHSKRRGCERCAWMERQW